MRGSARLFSRLQSTQNPSPSGEGRSIHETRERVLYGFHDVVHVAQRKIAIVVVGNQKSDRAAVWRLAVRNNSLRLDGRLSPATRKVRVSTTVTAVPKATGRCDAS